MNRMRQNRCHSCKVPLRTDDSISFLWFVFSVVPIMYVYKLNEDISGWPIIFIVAWLVCTWLGTCILVPLVEKDET